MDRRFVQAHRWRSPGFAVGMIVPGPAKTTARFHCAGLVRQNPPDGDRGHCRFAPGWRVAALFGLQPDRFRPDRLRNVGPVATRTELAHVGCGSSGEGL